MCVCVCVCCVCVCVQVRDQINCEHRQVGLVERSMECARRLVELYQDRDGERGRGVCEGGSEVCGVVSGICVLLQV